MVNTGFFTDFHDGIKEFPRVGVPWMGYHTQTVSLFHTPA
jgi:hypothetical protein